MAMLKLRDVRWEDFQKATNNGGSRTSFDDDALMFTAGTPAKRVVNKARYLAMDPQLAIASFAEGRSGYKRKSYYNSKPSLIKRVARKSNSKQKIMAGS
ncbi:hypothetical protein OK016_06040 [Vibrio chagasii]|nr:hypothetical protein [Vibrio chagasii]